LLELFFTFSFFFLFLHTKPFDNTIMGQFEQPTRAKLVLVGDDGSGKTCLFTVYARKEFPVVSTY
jgi:GTPase SAR1 family protein